MTRDLDPTNWMAEKLSWANTACRDAQLSHLAARVALLIMNDLNGAERCAFRGQDGIATAIGSNPRSVRAALAELIKAGYLRKQGRGRGNTNAYFATFPIAKCGEPGSHDRRISAAHTSNVDKPEEVMTGEISPPRPAEFRRQTLRENPYPPAPQTRDRRRTPERDAPPMPRPRFRDSHIRAVLSAELGDGFVVSYLDQAAWDGNARRVVCRSPTGHERLIERAGKALSAMGVRVVLDPDLFSRLPRPVLPMALAA